MANKKFDGLVAYYQSILAEAFTKEQAAFKTVMLLDEHFKTSGEEANFPGRQRFQSMVHACSDLYVLNQLIHLFGLSPWQDDIMEKVIESRFARRKED